MDETGRVLRMVGPDRLIAVLSEEHEENLGGRIGGFRARSGAARSAAEEACAGLWHRLPWLAIGLVGAMESAGVVA